MARPHIKLEICKFASVSLTVRDRAISSKFSIRRVSEKCTLGNFKKIFPPKKWRPFWIFEFLPKMAKHKFTSISLTVWDRAISSKFSTHRVPKQCTLSNFQKIFLFPHMAAILNFRILSKMEKHKFAYLLNCARFSTPRVSEKMYSWQFSKKFPLPKNGGHFEFLPKMAKHKFASISLTLRDRAILSKFSTHRVPKQCTLSNFQKIFLFPKMATILNFRIFAKNWKTETCFYLLNRAR